MPMLAVSSLRYPLAHAFLEIRGSTVVGNFGGRDCSFTHDFGYHCYVFLIAPAKVVGWCMNHGIV